MKKLIRRWGVIVFLLILAAGLAFIYLYADRFLKDLIEEKGTGAVGAKLELSTANLSLFPLGVSLSGLQVTNPGRPMKNAVEINRLTFSLDWSNLFLNKLVINEMTLQGIRMDTDRRTSGAIEEHGQSSPGEKDKKKNSSPAGFDWPSFDKIPDIKEILEKEELESLALAREIEYDINTMKNRWLTRLSSEIPDQSKIKDYEKRIRKLKKLGKGTLLDILGRVADNADELTSLYNDLSRDYKRIEAARKDFKKDFKSLKKRIKQVEKISRKDISRLKEKYRIFPQGFSNVSQMLFGGKIGEKVEAALGWYEKIQPYLDGQTEGRPKDEETKLDFLVRRINVSGLQTEFGVMSGKIRNLAWDQSVPGKPLTFAFEGKQRLKSARLAGVFDHVVPESPQDTLTFGVREYLLHNLVLSDQPPQVISLQKGLLNFDLNLALVGEKLSGKMKADLHAVEFSVGGDKGKDKILSSMLDGISGFNLRATITGTLQDYRIELKSGLDRVFKDAFASLIKDRLTRMEQELGSEIMKKAGGALGELNRKLVDFKSLEVDLAKRLQKLGTLNERHKGQ